MRVALYCRISTDEDLQKYSLANQEGALRQHAARRGWEVAGVFVDRVSGSKASRPGLGRLLDVLGDGGADAVLVTEQDRLSRLDEIPWALLKQTFRAAGTKLYTLSGEVDFGNEDHEFTADILALIDRRRRKTIVRQMVRGRAAAVRRGEWLGRPPFGYRRNPASRHLEPHPVEAPLVREIFRLFAQGRMGSRRIAAAVRDRVAGKRVDAEFVVRILRNPVYVGAIVAEVGGEQIRAEGAHEPIVRRSLWERCNHLLGARSAQNRKARLESTVGLVAGLVYCGACGNPLSPTTAQKLVGGRVLRYRYYRHVRGHRAAAGRDGRTCRAAHRADRVDALARKEIAEIAATPAVRRQLLLYAGGPAQTQPLAQAYAELQEQAAGVRRKRERLLQLFLAGEWDRARLDAEKCQIDHSLAALEREMRDLQARMRLEQTERRTFDLIAEAFAVLQDLGTLPLAQQQAVLRGLVERVDLSHDGLPHVTAKAPPDRGPAQTGAHAGGWIS